MQRYRRIQLFLATTMVLYVLGAVVAKVVVGGPGEVFPVFTWSLFCSVPNTVDDYAIRIAEVDGQAIAGQPTYQEADQWFEKAGSINAYVSIQRLGKALARQDAAELEDVRRFFEPVYLGDQHAVTYRVVRRTGSLMTVWETGAFDHEQPLAELETGRP